MAHAAGRSIAKRGVVQAGYDSADATRLIPRLKEPTVVSKLLARYGRAVLAQFLFKLPYTIMVSAEAFDQVASPSFSVAGLEVLQVRPYKTRHQPGDLDISSTLTMRELSERLFPEEPSTPVSTLSLNGGQVIACDGLNVTFQKEHFVRSRGSIEASTPPDLDPPIGLALSVANDWLQRARTVGGLAAISYLSREKTPWRVDFVNDDGSELQENDQEFRSTISSTRRLDAMPMTAELLRVVNSLPSGYKPSAADTLLLDAQSTLGDVGPAIVLAMTAIETRVTQSLDILARIYQFPSGAWNWINNRGYYMKEPSIDEKLDSLLKALTGRTLKEESALWEGFKNLQQARNKFAHEGVARIGNDVVDQQRVGVLLGTAREIVDWIEGLLPEGDRGLRLEVNSTFSLNIDLGFVVGGEPPNADPDEQSNS